MTVECVLDLGAALGECPVWDGRTDRLWWADIEGRRLHRFDPATGVDEVRVLPGRPGSFALTDDPDRILVAMEHELVDVAWSEDRLTPRFELEPSRRGTRLNDGRCDAAGRFWVGSMDDPTDTGAFAGWLHRVEPDGSTERVRDGIGISNALAFSPEGTVMYHADTLRDVIWAYDYDLDTGDRHNERVFADFAHLRGRPDGACVDADGCLWVAAVYGSAVLRLTPDGALDRTVELPVERPTMPAFGGVGLDTVFVTSIGEHRSTEFAGGTLDGAVFAFPAPRAGIPEPRFGG